VALRYTKALTRAADTDRDAAFQRFHDALAEHFSPEEMLEIVAVVVNMNVWTRIKLAEGAMSARRIEQLRTRESASSTPIQWRRRSVRRMRIPRARWSKARASRAACKPPKLAPTTTTRPEDRHDAGDADRSQRHRLNGRPPSRRRVRK
jgi:hypothetical protein